LTKPSEKKARFVAIAVAAVVAGASFGFSAGYAIRWISCAGLLLALPFFWRETTPTLWGYLDTRRPDWRELAGTYAPYLAVAIGVLISLGPVAFGSMPVSQDHSNHYFATHILTHEMIASGRFFGWTDSIGTGYPFGDLYHTPSYVVTGLVHLLSFGLVDLQVSYAMGITFAWLLPALAVTAWARRIAGPFGATIAGLVFALDMGGDREGGWIYSMFHGVWAQHLATGVWLLGLLALWRLTEKQTTRRLAVAVLVSGLCLWIHPMNALTLLGAGALLFVLQLLMRPRKGTPDKPQAVIILVPALFFAGLIGLAWIGRMMLASDLVYAYQSYWQPLDYLMGLMYKGSFFSNQVVFVGVLAVIGIVHLIWQGGRFRTFTLLLTALLVLTGSMLLIVETDLGLAGGKIGLIQYRRFSLVAKPLWYAMAGAGFSAIGHSLYAKIRARARSTMPIRILTALFFAPFVLSIINASPEFTRSPIGQPLTLERTGDKKNLKAIQSILNKEKKRCQPGLCKAVYWENHGHGGLYPVISMADTGFAWQPTLSLPANNFTWLNPTKDIDTMARLGVSVIISKWKQQHPRLEEIGRFGRHTIYRLGDVSTKQVEIQGPGEVVITTWEPERRIVRLTGTTAETRLVFLMPPYKKWKAYQSKTPLTIVSRRDNGLIFSEIQGVQDGEVLLEFSDSVFEKAFLVIGLLLIVGCIVLIVSPPKPIPSLIDPRHSALIYRVSGIGIGLVFVALIVTVMILVAQRTDAEWLRGEPKDAELLAVLHRQKPSDFSISPPRYCVPAYVRNPQFDCSEHDLSPVLKAAKRRNGVIPSCLEVGIPKNGQTELTFRLPNRTSAIKGRVHYVSGGPFTTTLHTLSKNRERNTIALKGNTFNVPVSRNSDDVTFVFNGKTTAKLCLEAVAINR
jgi:hypothetical protein